MPDTPGMMLMETTPDCAGRAQRHGVVLEGARYAPFVSPVAGWFCWSAYRRRRAWEASADLSMFRR
ncbi:MULTISPECIES: hypothetical protein [Roseiflexus]|uniref:hypothetical protein n=1 Tax=Roseiflexus TaxID=120961 RepID=UPI0002F6D15B|nr:MULTISPECIES: hypothetical protein [Roseiflexus]